MHSQSFSDDVPRPRWLLAALFSATLSLPVAAQNFEAHYGETAAFDRGEYVKAVNACPDRGSIVVGSRRANNAVETLVTRTDALGTPLWQNAYRVAGAESSQALGVTELRDGSGFALTGSVSRDMTRIFAMRIRCNGDVVWTVVMENQGSPARAIGYDIIEAPSLVAATLPPDLIVVGDELSASGSSDGRVIRIDASGNVLSDLVYIEPATVPGVRFRAVTLAPSAAAGQQDLVIAGSAGRYINWSFDRRGLMVRLRADGTPICNAMLGSSDSISEDYFGLTALTTAVFNGETVLVGGRTFGSSAQPRQAYLTRFRAGFCVPVAQALWTFPQHNGSAYDTVEYDAASAGVAAGIAVTGSLQAVAPAADGFVAWANPVNLLPFIPLNRFGVGSADTEQLFAIDAQADRVVMAGFTNRDWQGVGDPRDSYLVQTTPQLQTQCSTPWTIPASATVLPNARFIPDLNKVLKFERVQTEVIPTRGFGYCCALAPG
jgi:hypothetical protein